MRSRGRRSYPRRRRAHRGAWCCWECLGHANHVTRDVEDGVCLAGEPAHRSDRRAAKSGKQARRLNGETLVTSCGFARAKDRFHLPGHILSASDPSGALAGGGRSTSRRPAPMAVRLNPIPRKCDSGPLIRSVTKEQHPALDEPSIRNGHPFCRESRRGSRLANKDRRQRQGEAGRNRNKRASPAGVAVNVATISRSTSTATRWSPRRCQQTASAIE